MLRRTLRGSKERNTFVGIGYPRGDGPIRQVECEREKDSRSDPHPTQETGNGDRLLISVLWPRRTVEGRQELGEEHTGQPPLQFSKFQVQGGTLSPKIRCLWLSNSLGLKDSGELILVHIPFCARTQKTSLEISGKEGLCDTEVNDAKPV